MNKELIEKMRQAIYNIPVTMDLTMETVFPIAETCAAVAHEHYNKWIDVKDNIPEDVSKVFFATKIYSIVYEGRFFEQNADFNKPHFVSDRGVRYTLEEVSGWMYRRLPEPPKNI